MLKQEGRHFRRQVPIAGFIADFACHKCRLIIGAQHNTPEGLARDDERTLLLKAEGFRVLRFWNADVFQNIEGVIDTIRYAAGLPTTWSYESETEEKTPPLTPPRKGRTVRGKLVG